MGGTLDALPEVVEAVNGRVPVLVDGGIRRGGDVIKALALGARAILIGRPFLWGLAAFGQDGVQRVVELLHGELRIALGLSGAGQPEGAATAASSGRRGRRTSAGLTCRVISAHRRDPETEAATWRRERSIPFDTTRRCPSIPARSTLRLMRRFEPLGQRGRRQFLARWR